MNRTDRKFVRDEITNLVYMNLLGISLEDFRAKIEQVKELFKTAGVAPDSQFRVDLEDVAEKARLFYANQARKKTVNQNVAAMAEPDFGQPKRDYFGKAGEHHLRVTPVFDHLFVSENYRRVIKLDWRFNQEGRIDLVDSMLFPENRVMPLIKISGFERIQKNWTSARAAHLTFPYELGEAGLRFYTIEDKKANCGILLTRGHSLARELVYCLRHKKTEHSSYKRESQNELAEVARDCAAMTILERAANLEPRITEMKEDSLFISYGNHQPPNHRG